MSPSRVLVITKQAMVIRDLTSAGRLAFCLLYLDPMRGIGLDRRGGETSAWLCLVLLPLTGCQPLSPADGIFDSDVEEVVIEVDYLAEAEPCDGWIANPYDQPADSASRPRVWDLFFNNLQILFAPAPRELTIQRAPAPIGPARSGCPQAEDDRSYSEAEILQIVSSHRDEETTSARRAFYVIFLDGYYEEGGTVRREVQGRILSGDSGAIAMFKPALRHRGWFGEQSTLIHEFGHAVGLVNRGLGMVHPHQDSAHGSHCDDPGCVMHYHPVRYGSYRTELPPPNQSLFCPRCLEDAYAASDGQLPSAY